MWPGPADSRTTLSCRPCLPCRRRKCRTAGSLRSTGITPLRRYYEPVRHPLAVGRFPGSLGYTPDLTPLISPRDEEGFSSCSMRLCHRSVAPSTAVVRRGVSRSAEARGAFEGETLRRSPGYGTFEA